MNTLNDLLAAYGRALTAYDDCPGHRDAHTLAASRFYAIDYEDVTPYQRAWVKHATFAYRGSQTITVDRPIVVTEQVPPDYSLNLTHPGSITGRTTKHEPEWQDLPPRIPRSEIARKLADFAATGDVGAVRKASKRRIDERTREYARQSRVDPRVLNQPCMAFDYTPLELQTLAHFHAQELAAHTEAEPSTIDGASHVSFRVSGETVAALTW